MRRRFEFRMNSVHHNETAGPRRPLAPLDCGDLSPLSRGDLSPSHARAACFANAVFTVPASANARVVSSGSENPKATSRLCKSGDESQHSKNSMRRFCFAGSIHFQIRLAAFLAVFATSTVFAHAGETNSPAPVAPASAPETVIDWAKEQQFWSFRAPVAQARPGVAAKSWPRQPLDFFILARLEAKALAPSPEADRRTLIRRATYDLTGLPPQPDDVAEFIDDRRADAYERLIERLLASPAFGERMASLWLPLARYAEDQAHQVGGDTKLFYPNAWRYREWVIGAFNRDLPFDRFAALQLAADKIEGTNSPNLAALGLLGLGPKYYNRGRLDVMADEWEDRVDTVTRSFLGLTVACARCHDHKFDPITMRDYYALAGVFASTRMVNKTATGKIEDSKNEAAKMSPETLHIVEEGSAQNLNVFIRGNVDRKGPVADRRFLRVLAGGAADGPLFRDGSGRSDLARSIADRTNPLTARVWVNRVWGQFFGHPLVVTPSNFGHLGERPTHPELLDDLAVRFMNDGWSVKNLVREIMLSATYRQSSQHDSKKSALDVANENLWRMNRRRLSIEQWRDTALSVSGTLDAGGGKSLELDDAKNLRRTVYARVSRLKLNDLFMQFDYPDANVHAERRATSTTAMQKLFLLNSPFVIGRARALGARVDTGSPSQGDSERIETIYKLLFGRAPEAAEVSIAAQFLKQPGVPGMTRWEQYAQMLLASNELMYVD
jgi:hypothetical protein